MKDYMAKRKAEKKQKQKDKKITSRQDEKQKVPLASAAIKLLSIFLSLILIVALTLYVIGKMPARGFFILAAILAILAFVIIPVMRKKFA